jgi:hypothetical protein
MEKWLKEFNYDSIDGNRGLMQVLTSPLKDLSSVSKEKPESTLIIERDQIETFLEINNIFYIISKYMAQGEGLNPLKISLKNFDSQLEDLQKQFIVDYQLY